MLRSRFSPGDAAPAVRLKDGYGRVHELPRRESPSAATVLVFFRGHW